jgi:hypothetical protein
MAKAPWVVWADPLVPVAPHPPRSVPGSHRIPCAPSLRRGANRQWPRPCPWDVRPDRSGPPEVVPTSADALRSGRTSASSPDLDPTRSTYVNICQVFVENISPS